MDFRLGTVKADVTRIAADCGQLPGASDYTVYMRSHYSPKVGPRVAVDLPGGRDDKRWRAISKCYTSQPAVVGAGIPG